MRTRSYLIVKLTSAIEKMKKAEQSNSFDNSPVFNAVCVCPLSGGKLLYDANKDQYVYKGFCNPNRLCARIQRDKHRILIKKSYNEINAKNYYFDSISNTRISGSLTGDYTKINNDIIGTKRTSLIQEL